MVNPNQVNRRAYAQAQEMILLGKWVVDAEAGTIWSRKTQALLAGGHVDGGYRKHCVTLPGIPGASVLRHRVIWESVHGPVPDWLEINHKDGDTSRNGIANLEAITHPQNVAHAYRIGLSSRRCGEPGTPRKLTDEQVREIRALLAVRTNQYWIAEQYGINQSVVSDIKRRKLWAHVDPEPEATDAVSHTG